MVKHFVVEPKEQPDNQNLFPELCEKLINFSQSLGNLIDSFLDYCEDFQETEPRQKVSFVGSSPEESTPVEIALLFMLFSEQINECRQKRAIQIAMNIFNKSSFTSLKNQAAFIINLLLFTENLSKEAKKIIFDDFLNNFPKAKEDFKKFSLDFYYKMKTTIELLKTALDIPSVLPWHLSYYGLEPELSAGTERSDWLGEYKTIVVADYFDNKTIVVADDLNSRRHCLSKNLSSDEIDILLNRIFQTLEFGFSKKISKETLLFCRKQTDFMFSVVSCILNAIKERKNKKSLLDKDMENILQKHEPKFKELFIKTISLKSAVDVVVYADHSRGLTSFSKRIQFIKEVSKSGNNEIKKISDFCFKAYARMDNEPDSINTMEYTETFFNFLFFFFILDCHGLADPKDREKLYKFLSSQGTGDFLAKQYLNNIMLEDMSLVPFLSYLPEIFPEGTSLKFSDEQVVFLVKNILKQAEASNYKPDVVEPFIRFLHGPGKTILDILETDDLSRSIKQAVSSFFSRYCVLVSKPNDKLIESAETTELMDNSIYI